MKNNTSQNSFWGSLPLVSSLVIAASVLIYLGWTLDPNKHSDNSFFNLLAPGLSGIRNGRYLGLLTSSLIETTILFLAWGIGWIWYFGKTIENRVNIFFYIFLIISSSIFSELFQILIFEQTSYGLGGTICALFGFMWFMSAYEPIKWSVTNTEKLSFIAFISLCVLLDYTRLLRLSIGGLIGGFIWGVFVGLVSRSIKSKILQISIPILMVGVFLIPIFWAPWQISWLLNEAERYEKQDRFEEAIGLYSKILKKDSANQAGKEGLIDVLSEEADKYDTQEEFEKEKAVYHRILELDPNNKFAKENLIGELEDEAEKYLNQKEYQKVKDIRTQLLEIDPNNSFAKDRLRTIPGKTK